MIELKNLSIGYTEPLIEPLNFKFESQIYGILGESGSGKTTLLRTICGLQAPLSGQVLMDGEVVQKVPKNIFMMHQHYTNYDWLTCIQNIVLPAKIKGELEKDTYNQALEILDLVGLKNKAKAFPYELSGGQKQRLAFARTLFIQPEYLLMDEPLSALDFKTRESMQRLIKEYQERRHATILMITHSEEEAFRVCQKIIRLQKGRMCYGD